LIYICTRNKKSDSNWTYVWRSIMWGALFREYSVHCVYANWQNECIL